MATATKERYTPTMPAQPLGDPIEKMPEFAGEPSEETAEEPTIADETENPTEDIGIPVPDAVTQAQIQQMMATQEMIARLPASQQEKLFLQGTIGTPPPAKSPVAPKIVTATNFETVHFQPRGSLESQQEGITPLNKTRYRPEDRHERDMHFETREAMARQQKFGVMLPKPGKDEPNYVDVTINGLRTRIMREKYVGVAEAVYLQLVEAGLVSPQREQDMYQTPTARLQDQTADGGTIAEAMTATGDGTFYGTGL